MTRLGLALACLAACAGETGTIQLELVVAPGSTLLDRVERLRVTITNPRSVVEATRGPDGIQLALDVEATGAAGALIVEGFDGGDALIAAGSSPPFPVAAINARVVVYVAEPLSIAPAVEKLPAPRAQLGTTALTYGLAIAGGADAAGVASDAMFIYNDYDHSLVAGRPMPAARAAPLLATGTNNGVYIFGGLGPDGVAAGTLWRFDTTAPPSGTYQEIETRAELARAGERAVPVGVERFVLTGAPPVDLSFAVLTARGDVPALSANAASVIQGDAAYALFAGDPIVRLRDDVFDTIAASAEPTATAAALPDGSVVFAGAGGTRDLLVVDPTGGSRRITDALSTVRRRAAVAATARHLVVAGGLDADGNPLATADILDATTLAPITTVPCAPRAGAAAHVFLNEQIILVGGEPATDLIELFTPPPPP